MKPERVPVGELIDVAQLGPRPSPSDLRAALPRGWVLDDDLVHAVRDRRWIFSQSWVLLCAMIAFATIAIGIFVATMPRGWRGLARVAILLGLLVLIGGVIGPLVTRALARRR